VDQGYVWQGPETAIAHTPEKIRGNLRRLESPCYVIRNGSGVGVSNAGVIADVSEARGRTLVATAPPVTSAQLGDAAFRETYGLRYAYVAGSMANGISSTDLVVALGKAGMLGAFGAGGLPPAKLEAAIREVQTALPEGPYAFNLIHSPNEPVMERKAVALYLRHGVRTIEASAYLRLTPALVHYRAAGLSADADGNVVIGNRVLAKVSRREVATRFMSPAPEKLLGPLVEQGAITPTQARLAQRVPMADDVTVEADSGGHTDNRPLVCMLPSILALRDELQAQYAYAVPVRVGAAGGLSTPSAILGAFTMGAAYVMTGSINQACVEAGTSARVKQLLAEAAATDVIMAPAADMFEMGVNVQVLKRGTMFPLRAQKLYQLYETYDAWEQIPVQEREKLESRVFQRTFDEVWESCVAFFNERDPSQIARAKDHPKRKMALVFRWYLGLATHWGIQGVSERAMDYQIWCGPAMGAFNDWARGSYLEQPERRHVADVGEQLLQGAAYLYRVQNLRVQGVDVPAAWCRWLIA
jgi:PfaD family protein